MTRGFTTIAGRGVSQFRERLAIRTRIGDWQERGAVKPQSANFLLITLDSCRYDSYCDAQTPVLDSFGQCLRAASPANYTYAAHHSFFVGIFPNVDEPLPYYNRFTRQLVGLLEVGESPVKKSTYFTVRSHRDAVDGFRRAGFKTDVGTGAMNWFRQLPLTSSFEQFRMLTHAEAQVDYLVHELPSSRPFFGFINLGETHDPFQYARKSKAVSSQSSSYEEWRGHRCSPER